MRGKLIWISRKSKTVDLILKPHSNRIISAYLLATTWFILFFLCAAIIRVLILEDCVACIDDALVVS